VTITRLKSPDAAARWLREWVTGTLRTDSRQVQPGDAFIAWPGYAQDGRQFARTALVAGATTCLVEHEGVSEFAFEDARIASLPNLKASTGLIADAFFEQPSSRLDVIAVTGTNGKTSTAWWTAQAFTALRRRCGVVGTLGIGEPPLGEAAANIAFTGLTTPDPVLMHAAMRNFADANFQACAIEASSIGLVEQRMAGLRLSVALFTNFTRDHLDFHGSMEAYWEAKRTLFSWPGLKAAVINIDDEQGAKLAEEASALGLDVWTYSLHAPARLQALELGYQNGGLAFELREGEQAVAVRSSLIGNYNASNLLAVLGGLRALGVPLADAASVVPLLTPVPGRMQRVSVEGQPEVVVDYAHTPDALDKALTALRPFAQARGGQLVCVFGCGGNRDATKRPLMGAIAARLADQVVLTSDNPRGEVPGAILEQIAAGIDGAEGRVKTIENRHAAIAYAVGGADVRDVVLIAGKGHEDYQEIDGVKHPFLDAGEAMAALRGRAA
jgi:UDP-N-acetylmuramoyl-L-alanyl-D-glutamate--2,6-diaminopimelate ligase